MVTIIKKISGRELGASMRTKLIGWRFGNCCQSEWRNLQILVGDMDD